MGLRQRLEYNIYLSLFKPLSWLPLPLLYLISNLMRMVFEQILHYRRRVIRENLSTCYPHKTIAELREIEKKFYRQFCDNIVETIKLLSISDRTMRRHIEVVGAELVEQAADSDHSTVLFLGHYCNWEWVPAITLFYNRPKISTQLYKPLHNRAFDKLMLKIRGRFGSISIDKDKAFRELLRLRRDHGPWITGFIADSRTSHADTGHYTEFLRHRTWFYPGGEEIGRRANAEFIYLDVERIRRGHYRFEFKPIITDPDDTEPYPVTRQYLKMLQATIDREPAYWMWSHRRWVGSQIAIDSNSKQENKNKQQ